MNVRELFAGPGVTLELERDVVDMPYESGAEAFDFGVSNFGPLIMQVVKIYGRGEPAEYLVVLGRKA